MIKINEKTIALWYMNTIKNQQDFMGSLFTDDDGHLKFVYRFRYYKSDSAWDRKDVKHWYTMEDKEGKNTLEFMLENVRGVVQTMSAISGQPYDEILMKDGNVEQFMQEMLSKPWNHMRMESIAADGQNRTFAVDKGGEA